MRIISTGETYLIRISYTFLLLKICDELSTSSITVPGLTTNPTNRHVNSATTGIRILLDTKSNISRIDIPLILMPLNTPNPSDDGIAKINVYMVTHIVINAELKNCNNVVDNGTST